ncbi:N-6 DNA methylase [Enterococcus faecalis]
MNPKSEILKKLHLFSRKHSLSTVYYDWIHLMAFTVSNSCDKHNYEERENQYLHTISKYTEEEAHIFAECFGLLILAFENKHTDWLGEIYMELQLNSTQSGQVFTPYHVAKLMAELTFDSNEPQLIQQNYLSYYEPCCGAGSLIIALSEVMVKKNYNFQKQLIVHCEDIDENCLLMCYVQLSILGIKAICKVKNSLCEEPESSVWKTPFYQLSV